MRIEQTQSYPVSIFIAGDYHRARIHCACHCDEVGLCVTVTGTTYVYTGGEEPGVIVGLINYPRFPSEPKIIWQRAEDLAKKLRKVLGQESFTIQAPDKTVWFSFRPEDTAKAIEAGTATTPKSGVVRKDESAVGNADLPGKDHHMTDRELVERLKPCPFCGGIGHPYERPRGNDVVEGVVECGTCGCEMYGLDQADAISAWNNRLNTDDAVDEEVVERVARAMFDAEMGEDAARADPAWIEAEWQDEKLAWLNNARAALAAMGKKS